MGFLGEMWHPDCDHTDQTSKRRGFGLTVKDLSRADDECELCEIKECSTGGGIRQFAIRFRIGQAVAAYGAHNVEVSNFNPHDIEMRCVDPAGGAWVWEFCADEPESIEQAQRNLDHIVEHLGAQGIKASPGPAFPEEHGLILLTSSVLARLRSDPSRPGVELVEVFDCKPCSDYGVGPYRDAVVRGERSDDRVGQAQVEQGDKQRGRAAKAPFGRPASEPERRMHCLLSVDGVVDGRQPTLLRAFFGAALRLVDEAHLMKMMSASSDGHHSSEVEGVPGTPAGILQTKAWGDRRGFDYWGSRLTRQSWQELLDGFSSPPARAKMWCGEISEDGWAQTTIEDPNLVATSGFLDRSHTALSLKLDFAEGRLAGEAFQRQLLRSVRSLAEELMVSFAEIGHQPWTRGSEFPQTMLERLLYRTPRDTILASRSTLRGYSWLTICAEEIGDRLGGVAALQATGAFHEVSQLAYGGYWLQATERFQQYDVDSARRVFGALAAALPPGRPGRYWSLEPNLLVPEDASALNEAAA
jgi:hypothetical protein